MTTPTTWNTFRPVLMSKLDTAVPAESKVADSNAIRSVASRPPTKFDMHIPKDRQLRYVKWAPNLVPLGMEKLRSLHPDNTPASDPGSAFWYRNDVNHNVARLRRQGIVTGEKQIQPIMDQRILQPLCTIASRILFHLNEQPPEEDYFELETQTGDVGPPLWDTVIKLSSPATSPVIQTLIEGIIYAMELKSLTVAPSSFFYRLCSRAAANAMSKGPIKPKPFDFQARTKGPKCRHAKKSYTPKTIDVPSFFEGLTQLPAFDPSDGELARLLSDLRVYNDDHGDKSGSIIENDKATLAKHPRVHVALAIMRTGVVPLEEDKDDDPVAQSQPQSGRRMGARDRRPNAKFSVAAEAQTSRNDDGSKYCRKWKWEGGSSFDEHYTLVLQQLWAEMLYRDLTFASLTTLKHAVMVCRSRSEQTLYVSTPFLPGATTPTFTQALLSQMICAYQEAQQRDAHGGSADGGDGDEGDEKDNDEDDEEDSDEDDEEDNDEDDKEDDSEPPRGRRGRGRGGSRGGSPGGAPPRGGKRKGKEPEPGPSKRPRGDSLSDYDKIPVATLSTVKQLALAKLMEIGDVYLCVHDGFYDSTTAALLRHISHPSDRLRRAVSPAKTPSLTSSASTGSNSSMDSVELIGSTLQPPHSLCLTQRLGEGAVGEVWRGVISPASESSPVLDVVAKVGWTKGARNGLINEADIYHLLRKKGIDGVPLLIGLFDDVDDRVPILITTYAGDKIRNVNASLKTQFHRIVQDLHKAGVCHGDLRKENMCHLDGHASITDFDRAFKTSKDVDFSRDEQDLELAMNGG